MGVLFGRKTTREKVLGMIADPQRTGKGWDDTQAARVRAEIEKLLGEGDVDALIRVLETSRVFDADAARALGHLGDRKALPALLDCLRAGRIRDQVLLALAGIGDEAAILPIVDIWKPGYFGPFEQALVRLAENHRSQVLAAVIPLVQDPNRPIRRAAIYCLRALAAHEAVPVLVAALEDEDASCKLAAIGALDAIGGPVAQAAVTGLHSRQQ
jgi:HEAT repeat protein